MILQELNRYYERKVDEPDSAMPAYGTSRENISFALVLDEQGVLLSIEDLRVGEGNKRRPRKMTVPAAEKKASGIIANFLWDSSSYVLGIDDKGKPARAKKCREAFVELIRSYCDVDDPGLDAVRAFLATDCRYVQERADWPDICKANLVFRLDGVKGFVHERKAARLAWERCLQQKESATTGQCLISGETAQPLARLHPSIKGVRGAQSSGASIVSFNKPAFESFGKAQSINAPVSQRATFKYATALNALLGQDSRQKVVIGDTTVVFWAERDSEAELFFAELFAPEDSQEKSTKSKDDQNTAAKIFDLLRGLRTGRRVVDIMPDLDDSVRFFVLGLAPNAARLSIRLWLADDLRLFLERVSLHFEQLALVRRFDNEPEFPPLWRLLCHTASQGKSENVSPVLAGGMIKALLSGGRYPDSLLPVVLGRIRAERELGYFRAALLKAFLIRNHQLEVPMSLDVNRKDVPYLLGRLFAVLEKAQSDAVPGTNTTLKDRFFASAPATPARVFPMLLKNSANHTAKMRKDPERKGWAVAVERSIQDIVENLADFPSTMFAENQGIFMIGYYHQMKDLYTSKKTTKKSEEEISR
ncbi:MAG: type I-C CRISPR-associated protein Cas8c/Csd1 [Desulfopila sp.]